jgi:hypothetical protein
MPSCEDRVSDALYAWFSKKPALQIVSFHPPSGKAYGTDSIRIPKVLDGHRTRDRYHIDALVIGGSFLFLFEFKCRLSECDDDVAKLREINKCYRPDALVDLIRRRVTVDLDLSPVKHIIPGLGFEVKDRDTVPGDFLSFCTSETPPQILPGSTLDASISKLFL